MDLTSKLIKAIYYDPKTRVLIVDLRLKGRRHYRDVPASVVKNLISAESPGWYYTQNVRDCFPRAEEKRWRLSFAWLRFWRRRKKSG
jgi:KTSC domain